MAIKLADVLLYLGVDADELDEGLDDAREKTERWGNKLGKTTKMLVGGVVIGAATAAATAITAIGVSAFNVSRETEKAAAAMAAALNIPREEAEQFADVARNIYGNNFADSVTDAGDAVASVVRTLKLAADDPSLQSITEKAIALRDSFGEEVNETVSTARSLMENFGVSADQAFDLITAGFQRGLNRSDDFLDTINEYSVQFGNGGASAQEFFSIMESGLQGGMLGTDKAADAFKEFRVRILDGSKTTADGLAQIGLNVDDVTTAIDSGSMDIVDAWNLVIGKLKETEDQSVLMQAGVALIGTQFEDLGQDAVLAMEITKDAFADVSGATDALNKRYETFGDFMSGLWRRLVVSVSPLTDELLAMANESVPYLMAAFDRFDKEVLPALIAFGGTVHTVVTTVMGFFQNLGNTIDSAGTGRFAFLKEWIDTNLPLVQNLIQTILDNVQRFWETNGEAIMAIVTNTFDTVFAIVDTALKTLLDLITLVLQLLNGDFEGAGVTLVNIVTRIWGTLQTVIGNQLDNIRELILGIDWADLGKQMILGIGRGIAGAAQFLAAAATEAAQRAFDAAKNWLGIQSPSRRAAEEIGEPFSEGVGVGITRKLTDVAQDVQVGLRGLIGEVPVPNFAGQGATAGGMNIVINQTFNGAVNSDEVRRGAQDGILSAMR
ncbi:MAG: phage tail tape measure protein, partial [Caldilineaceae bacterium]